MVTSITMARFSISGEHIAEHARDLMKEGDWKAGLDYLIKSLPGMSLEQAISVLEGDNKLVGADDNIQMISEDPDVAATLKKEYFESFGMGGFLKKGRRMYQPYKVLDNLGYDDCSHMWDMPEIIRGVVWSDHWVTENEMVRMKTRYPRLFSTALVEQRGRYYMSRPDTDFAKLLITDQGEQVLVLFQEVTEGTTPFWRDRECTDPQAAFAQIENYLHISGYAQTKGLVHPRESVVAKSNPQPDRGSPEMDEETVMELESMHQKALAQEKAKQELCEQLRTSIVAFADADTEFGWFTYHWKPSSDSGLKPMTLKAPYRALINYALGQTTAHHLAPAYKAFSPESLKMYEDNVYHTDVWLGSGLALTAESYSHSSSEYNAVLDMMFEIQKKMLNFEVQVLARGPEVHGRVVFFDSPDIDENCVLVIPNAGVDFELQAMKAGAVISEVGGKLAHLVTVCREQSKPIIRMDNALTLLKLGQSVTVKPASGKVEVMGQLTKTIPY